MQIIRFLVCGYDNATGPHQLACLTEFWLEAGCLATGERAPASIEASLLAVWNSWTVGLVREDMADYYTFAEDGQQEYRAYCLG